MHDGTPLCLCARPLARRSAKRLLIQVLFILTQRSCNDSVLLVLLSTYVCVCVCV